MIGSYSHPPITQTATDSCIRPLAGARRKLLTSQVEMGTICEADSEGPLILMANARGDQMNFENPVIIYTAANNIEVHLIVDMLQANGVPAHAVEDQSVVGLWALGTISQIHKPDVWIDESMVEQARSLIEEFEAKRRARIEAVAGPAEINAVCEECGKTTSFPSSQKGTTQECSHCLAYIDVGDLPWEDDFGVPED